ncbi:hypothetical protein [Ureibacillus aquaedulcis]|uniref:Uncharacterized protein n=1 Tax=Ureibacillus aquaedulcis TaxID=3058421 RepID=A0ABT8GNQ5_9BACL|nr:hypothetical protein [Ureibacillus sp. BA0131]MDN4492979.1 hypothetical protein [Ureibacillus sp. BA0131]
MKIMSSYFFILLPVAFLIGCISINTNTETSEINGGNDLTSGLFSYSDSNFIYVDISKAFIKYAKESNLSYEDDQKQIKVKRTST